mgnify:CR=1 FL=1
MSDRTRVAPTGSFFKVFMSCQAHDWQKSFEDRRPWPAELLVFRAGTLGQLLEELERCRKLLDGSEACSLAELSFASWQIACQRLSEACAAHGADWLPTVAIVARSGAEAAEKLRQACGLVAELQRGPPSGAPDRPAAMGVEACSGRWYRLPRAQAIYFAEKPMLADGKLAALFPGQGVQQPGMFAQLASAFPPLGECLRQSDRLLEGRIARPLCGYVCEAPQMTSEQRRRWAELFRQAELAQPLMAAACMGMFRLLERLGLRPAMFAGHSFGEHVALCAAGAIDYQDLILLAYRRGVALMEAAAARPGGMMAVASDAETCRRVLAECSDVAIAAINAPRQVVISGTAEALAQAERALAAQRIAAERLEVAGPFHCGLMSSARPAVAKALRQCRVSRPVVPVWSNITTAPIPDEPSQVAQMMLEHTTAPLRFAEQIENMYSAGARVFVEIGPQNVLCRLVGRILRGLPHLAIATHIAGVDELVQLQNALAQLLVAGAALQLDYLYQLRGVASVPAGRDPGCALHRLK